MATFEEVDKHVKKLKTFQLPTTQAEAGEQLCEVYGAVKPVLAILVGLPIVPAKWKAVANSFLSLMDVFCPPAA